MIQLAWRFLMFQKDSALAQWYRARTADTPRRHPQDDDRRVWRASCCIALWQLVHHRRDAAGRRSAPCGVSGQDAADYQARLGVPSASFRQARP